MKNPFGMTEEKFVKKVLKDGYSTYLAFVYATLDAKKVSQAAKKITANMSQEEREAAREGLFEKMREARADIEEEVNAVLMPHQMTRIRQIALQQQLNRGGGGGGALTRGPVAEALGLTEVQIEELEAKRREIEEGLREKVATLQKEAQDELISVLTPSQQAKLRELLGESFEMQRQEQGRGGFGGGDRGGRGGGDRGGRTPPEGSL